MPVAACREIGETGDVSDRVALVTGGNRGIGRAVVEQLAAAGITAVVGSRSLDAGQRVADEVRAAGGSSAAVALDVADEQSVQAAIDEIDRRLGRLDIVVNNAAIHYDTFQRVDTADLAVVREAIETNTLGAWRTVLAALPMLRASGSGRVVNVSSGGGAWDSMTGATPAYSISKLAVNGLTRMLAETLGRDGVLVNAVCPGWVATDMGGAGGRPVADGAAGVVWAALLPDDGPTGQFFRDRERIPW